MPHIVWTHDPAGVPTYFNRRWLEYTGLDLAATLAVGADSLVHPGDLPEVFRLFGESRQRGSALEASYRLRRSDGAYRWHFARVVPTAAPDGTVSWVGTAIDVEDQRRQSQEQAFLAEASKVLGTSLDLAKTLSDVARLVVPHLADWCAIDLLTATGELERPAVAHVDPGKVETAWRLWRQMPPRPDDPNGVYNVVRTGQPELHADIPDSLLAQSIPDPEVLAGYRALGLRSSMCVPLVARGRALGALTLVSAESGRHYGEADLVFAQEFAQRIAFAVDNARLYAAATQARAAAEALAAEIAEESRKVEEAFLAMRAERDAALARAARDDPGSGHQP